MTPTQRTLKAQRELGRLYGCVENWNPHARIRQDLFGFIDYIALCPVKGVVGIQTTGTGFSAHLKKITVECSRLCIRCLAAGIRVELWGWRKLKVKRGGKAMRYKSRVQEITLADFGLEFLE